MELHNLNPHNPVFCVDSNSPGIGEVWKLFRGMTLVFKERCNLIYVESGELPERLNVDVPIAEEELTRKVIALFRYDIVGKTDDIGGRGVPYVRFSTLRRLPKGFHCKKEIGKNGMKTLF